MLKLHGYQDTETRLGRQKTSFIMLLVKTVWFIMTSCFFWRKRNADVLSTIELEPRHFGALSGQELKRMAMPELSGAIVSIEAALRIKPTHAWSNQVFGICPKAVESGWKNRWPECWFFRFSQLKFFRHFTLNSPLEIAQQFCLCLRISTLNQPLSLKN